jgi:hypothetical protein
MKRMLAALLWVASSLAAQQTETLQQQLQQLRQPTTNASPGAREQRQVERGRVVPRSRGMKRPLFDRPGENRPGVRSCKRLSSFWSGTATGC